MDIQTIDSNMTIRNNTEEVTWHNPKQSPFKIYGFAFFDADQEYCRIPQSEKKCIEQINNNINLLASNTAGGQIKFRTTSTSVSVKVCLDGSAVMCHMAATGQCGFDCYISQDNEQFTFAGAVKYDTATENYEYQICKNLSQGEKDVILNFPLYMGVCSVQVGLDPCAEIYKASEYTNKGRIVAYGTSITQGGCASRPGMAYTNLLSRWLDIEFINLGFSGNGLGETQVAKIVASIENTRLFIIDYEANAGENGVLKQTLATFVSILRDKCPQTPIVIISLIKQPSWQNSKRLAQVQERKDFQRIFVQSKADKNLHFIDGEKLLGEDWHECTVDGIHPNDLGFYKMASYLKPLLKKLL